MSFSEIQRFCGCVSLRGGAILIVLWTATFAFVGMAFYTRKPFYRVDTVAETVMVYLFVSVSCSMALYSVKTNRKGFLVPLMIVIIHIFVIALVNSGIVLGELVMSFWPDDRNYDDESDGLTRLTRDIAFILSRLTRSNQMIYHRMVVLSLSVATTLINLHFMQVLNSLYKEMKLVLPTTTNSVTGNNLPN